MRVLSAWAGFLYAVLPGWEWLELWAYHSAYRRAMGPLARLIGKDSSRALRLAICVSLGIGAYAVTAARAPAAFAAVLAWIVAAGVFVAWTWIIIGHMSARDTQTHASKEDGTRAVSDVVLIAGSVASLAGVGLLLLGARNSDSATPWEAILGVVAVAVSWLMVHTLFTLRYAALYYLGQPGGIDFNQDDPPDYRDFAYVAFTVGMTYQLSDTNVTRTDIRRTVLRQGLLSYVLGSVVLATTINLVVQLASAGGSGGSSGG